MKNTLNINNDTNRHKEILHVIPDGQLSAITMKRIADLLGVDVRTVRLLIEKARIDGNIIAGTDAGLFIPETDRELREYTSRTLSRIRTSVLTLDPALRLTGKTVSLKVEDVDHV